LRSEVKRLKSLGLWQTGEKSGMNEFTIGLAVYDFVPVIFTAVALFFIARLVQQAGAGQNAVVLAYVGGALVTVGGFLKALWKLQMALSGQDVLWMANALFPLMAPGFALLATAVWSARRQQKGKSAPGFIWFITLGVIGLVYALALLRMSQGIERGWFMPIMSLASIANLSLTVMLMLEAGQRRKWWLALLFVVNLAMVFALQQIAQIEPMTIALHWFEQTLTSVGAGAFALASYLLYRLVTADAPLTSGQPALA
jgi:hypothetical protein